ncbi:MAG: hypothetical protein AAF517_27405, partial [Planctomycetota bacterium]
PFVRGDADGSGRIELTDAIFGLQYLFLGGDAPSCADAADANDDNAVDLSDSLHVLAFNFLGGNPPPAPFPRCGLDETKDSLGCESYDPCVQ